MTAEDEHELLRIAEQARRELDVCQNLSIGWAWR